ncbi:hypothetical protein LTR17_027081 [Elasticomyces elasticus]|nr:hypothetical protein LTR17_027081 [Elasticomyces elasticus]
MSLHADTYRPTYHDLALTTSLGDATVHYVEAGNASKPTVLLLHGSPSSSNQFRDLIPLISDSYHVLAPDLPAFGLTKVTSDFVYTFDNLTTIIAIWLLALNITCYAVYIFDYEWQYLRLGLRVPFWDPIMALWNESNPNSEADRDTLRSFYLQIGGTNYQYTTDVPGEDQMLINLVAAQIDYHLNLEGTENQNRQLDLFYDYRNICPWGKGDPAFIPSGAEDFKKDLPNAQIYLLDAGHFALETKRWDIARLMKEFLKTVHF